MAVYMCGVCDTTYDEEKQGALWEALPEDWVCPVCEASKSHYRLVRESSATPSNRAKLEEGAAGGLGDTPRLSDAESYLLDIHEMAETGRSIVEPMRTRIPTVSWDEILIKGAQLARTPLNPDDPVSTRTVIGPRAEQPMVLESPIYITHMSFGALSKEAKIALAKGSAAVKTAMCSGEGGILPESLSNAHKYVFEYVPNKYSVTEENLKRVDAIEIKIGQSAKPGMGGHLPGNKVTSEIARIRGRKEGEDIVSPSRFDDIRTKDDLKAAVRFLRDASDGKPVGIKFAAGNIELDLEFALYAEPDFVTIDGRAGSTGAAPKFVKSSVSVPTIFAIYRARKFLASRGIEGVSLMVTGGLRVSPDFAKALAIGADAVAIGTSALIALGCQQYRICNTGKCPMGITTHDPVLRAQFDIDRSANRLANFLRVCTEELKDFARLTGNDDIHLLSLNDLCTTNSEISGHTDIEHV